MRVRAEQAGLAFLFESDPDLPVSVLGDEKRLRQVLLNLLGNAVKFTEEGRVRLKVSFENPSHSGGNIHFDVEDTGIGIGPQHLEEIFLPFQQVNDPRNRVEGTGLGLAITKKLISLMGGNLQVKSTPGQGSIFWFTLPLPTLRERSQGSELPIPRVIGLRSKPKRVLVVDDKWENRAVIVNILAPLGFEVFEASNGREGVEEAHRIQPDAILMDLKMPVMDGFEATRRVRESTLLQGLVVIALTASVFEHDRQTCKAAGCDDFLPKPVQAEQLFEKLQQHLGVEWDYETESQKEDQGNETAYPLITPPVEELADLFHLAKKGQIVAVRRQIGKIEQLGDAYKPFVVELEGYARVFNLKQLCEFLKPYLDGQK